MADYSGLASGILGAAGTVAGAITGDKKKQAAAEAARRRKAEYDQALRALKLDYQRQLELLRQQYRDVTPPPNVDLVAPPGGMDAMGDTPGLGPTELPMGSEATTGLMGAVPTSSGPLGVETAY